MSGVVNTAAITAWLTTLTQRLGNEHVETGEAVSGFAHDVFASGVQPLARIAPASVEDLRRVVSEACEYGVALQVRGGGASYTHGYLAINPVSVLLDLRRLNRIVEINETDAYVTVEAGITWQALKQALDERGLRTPFRGPFSGSVASVGGTVAQHGISHGTGQHGGAAQSILGLDVVLADGQLLSTGSAGANTSPFNRFFGPDFTGLFTGDCGAFGIKARVTLALLPATPCHAGASFAFDSFAALHAGMQAAARAGADETHFGLDSALLRGQLSRKRTLKDSLDIVRGVLRTSPSWWAAARQLLRMACAGERSLKQAPFLAHYLLEGADRYSLNASMLRLRTALSAHGREIANTVPSVIQASPFAKLFNILGPRGERWVPVHGLLPNSRVAAFHEALQDLYAEHEQAMKEHGVWTGAMFESVGPGVFMYEIGLYWPDSLADYHRMTLTARQRERVGEPEQQLLARAWVTAFKTQLVELFDAHGATHYQVGRVYPFSERLAPATLQLAAGTKCLLDPHGTMSPGVLGL